MSETPRSPAHRQGAATHTNTARRTPAPTPAGAERSNGGALSPLRRRLSVCPAASLSTGNLGLPACDMGPVFIRRGPQGAVGVAVFTDLIGIWRPALSSRPLFCDGRGPVIWATGGRPPHTSG